MYNFSFKDETGTGDLWKLL